MSVYYMLGAMKKHYIIFALVMAAASRHVVALEFSQQPTKKEYILGEPIVIVRTWNNTSSSKESKFSRKRLTRPVKFKIEELRVVKDDPEGEDSKLRYFSEVKRIRYAYFSGVYIDSGPLVVPPKSVHREHLVFHTVKAVPFSDYYNVKTPGRYRVSVSTSGPVGGYSIFNIVIREPTEQEIEEVVQKGAEKLTSRDVGILLQNAPQRLQGLYEQLISRLWLKPYKRHNEHVRRKEEVVFLPESICRKLSDAGYDPWPRQTEDDIEIPLELRFPHKTKKWSPGYYAKKRLFPQLTTENFNESLTVTESSQLLSDLVAEWRRLRLYVLVGLFNSGEQGIESLRLIKSYEPPHMYGHSIKSAIEQRKRKRR